MIFFLGIVIFIGCLSKKEKNNKSSLQLDTIPQFANISVEKKSPSALFSVLLNSANNFKPKDPIPDFFYNHLLDYEHPWLTDHNSFSIRKLIIDSTSNTEVLKAILISGDLRLKKIADSVEVSDINLLNALPYRNLSNYDMVRVKLKK